MVYIALTYDYELFFNEAFVDDDAVLIDPTSQIINMMNAHGVRGTFFVDTCMIQKFQQVGYNQTLDKIDNQIHEMHRNNMQVGLHMHCIWNSARLGQDGKWTFIENDYMPHVHGRETLSQNIWFGKKYLDQIAKEEKKVGCTSFRAGGYCFTPNTYLFDKLYDEGIRIDSSVSKYKFMMADNQHFNYLRIPKKDYWMIANGDLRKAAYGGKMMLEIPVAGINEIPYKWILRRKHKYLGCTKKGMSSGKLYRSDIAKKMEKIIVKFRGAYSFSADFIYYTSLIEYVEHYCSDLSYDRFMVMIAHPKSQDAYTICNLGKFIDECKRKFECKFITLDEMKEVIDNE